MKKLIKRIILVKILLIFLCIVVTIFVCAAILPAQSSEIKTKDQKAKETLNAALKALGGADKIEDIKSLIIKGKQNRDDSNETGEFEIRILWPDDYIHIRSDSAAPPPISGVSQGIILVPINPPPSERMLGWMLWRDMLKTTHVMMGTIMKPGIGQVILSSKNKSGVLDLALLPFEEDLLSDIEFDAKTGYPSVIRHKESSSFGGGAIEYQFSGERFSVGGVMFPRVIKMITTRSPYVGGELVTQEWLVEEVLINPKLSLKDFEVPAK